MTALRDRRLERGEHESASLPSLDVFPPLLSFNECQNAGFLFSGGGEEGGGVRKTKQHESRKKTKRTSVSGKVLTEHL